MRAAFTPSLLRHVRVYLAAAERTASGPRLERVASVAAHEGPIYVAKEHALYYTTPRPDVRIERLALGEGTVTVVREDANVANGMALDARGRLIVCEQGTLTEPAAITRVDRVTGAREVLVDAWRGRRLNSPNDVVVASDGAIWFTDPSYGHLQGFRPAPEVPNQVYRFDPVTGEMDAVANGFDKPNGLAFSPDERVLYVADNGAPHELLAFDVAGGCFLEHRRRIAVVTPEHPDGLKVDRAGRIYVSVAGGVRVLDRAGATLREIALPGAVNFAFAGGRLLITTDTAVWAADLTTRSA